MNKQDPSTFGPDELEFLAENELIDIIPNFRMDQLEMISGVYGPFRLQRPVKVPVWLAITLKKRQRCKICPPTWMDVDYLSKMIESERNDTMHFASLPNFYLEIAMLLLESAADDIPRPTLLRSLLQDLRDLRVSKFHASFNQIEEAVIALNADNLSMMEINEIRPFLTSSLDMLYKISKKADHVPYASQ